MKTTVTGVIPARYASSRFPGKPLARIAGRPMIEHVWRAAGQARFDRLLVATDDERIAEVVRAFGGEVMLTRPDHASGTDRLVEVSQRLELSDQDIVVNVQGDEPLLAGALIDSIVAPLLADPELECATAVTRFRSEEELTSTDTVKVVCDTQANALYFSRSVIPHDRDAAASLDLWRKHIGIYVYRNSLLKRFGELHSQLEQIERLEQLRLLQNGIVVRVIETDYQPQGVDRPEDVSHVESLLARSVQKDTSPKEQ